MTKNRKQNPKKLRVQITSLSLGRPEKDVVKLVRNDRLQTTKLVVYVFNYIQSMRTQYPWVFLRFNKMLINEKKNPNPFRSHYRELSRTQVPNLRCQRMYGSSTFPTQESSFTVKLKILLTTPSSTRRTLLPFLPLRLFLYSLFISASSF